MLDTKVPSAGDYAKRLAVIAAEEAEKEARLRQQAEEDKKALLDELQKPSGLSDDEVIGRALKMIEGAVQNGRTEVLVYRFPNQLCTDRGRAINQQEPGWEGTLTGVPKEVYEFWQRHFRDKGYRLRVEIVDFPNGMPGDVGMTLVWA